MNILVTGGAGYIGSHTCVQLLIAGHTVTVLDNLSNSSSESLSRVEKITGRNVTFVCGDILDSDSLHRLFSEATFDAVIHFAGLKSVNESMQNPLIYFQTNVGGTLNLLTAMKKFQVRQLVFSSTAAVYGESVRLPAVEEDPVSPISPYGDSKLAVEKVLTAVVAVDPAWSIAILRYFNPVGAHPTGLIGEDPRNAPSNLLPICLDTALGLRDVLPIYGDDYATSDGTGVRDFVHVMDLADGHVAALNYLERTGVGTCATFNLGTGMGVSVLCMVRAVETVTKTQIKVQVLPRRIGDIAASFADATKAEKLLRWRARRTVEDMCRDAWTWRSLNPMGFGVRESAS